MANIRVYAVVDTHLHPTEAQCVALFQAAAGYPLATAIRQAARAAQNYVTTHKRSLGTGYERRATMLGFEVDTENVPGIIAIVNEQAALRGIIEATNSARFRAVLEAEIRDAALDLGFSEAIANAIEITPWNFNGRDEMILAAQTYLANNDAIWHA